MQLSHRTLRIAPDPASARRARDVIRDVFAGTPAGAGVIDTVLLLASELVMNAVEHGRVEATMEVKVEPNLVRVAVTEDGPGHPEVQHTEGLFTAGGRGLLMVEEFSTRWGVEPHDNGAKTVWFELAYLYSA